MGLNLTKEVRDGILNHRSSGKPATLEGQAVRFADKIAYLNHDIDDAIRAGLFTEEELPREYTDLLGHSVKDRLNTLIRAVIFHSIDEPCLRMEPETEEGMQGLRRWMFQNVYTGGEAKREEWKVKGMLELLFDFYYRNPSEMTEEYRELLGRDLSELPLGGEEERIAKQRIVCDYIAGMTDDYCTRKFLQYFVPKGWQKY